ncbi:MAG: aspartate--tRNA(Asn) ligase [Candidatus Abawacabacteria bacterium]|nr:aspartate--tRNA(Asn) ligase [Candidatus Abawacabacteria bacterium]
MKGRVLVTELTQYVGKEVTVAGWIHTIRDLGKVAFVVLRDRSGIVQCVAELSFRAELIKLHLESVVAISGTVVISPKEQQPEIQVHKVQVISAVMKALPFEIHKDNLEVRLDTMLDQRLVSLRHLKTRAIFSAQDRILRYMREYFAQQDFTEMKTPKLIGFPTEGGSEVFPVKYYERTAYLAQSPQFYKQMMVSVFERVYEIAHAYRAEKSNTSRHMSELVMIDVEMGFIDSWRDIAEIAIGVLRYVIDNLWQKDQTILNLWPELSKPLIPEKVPEITVQALHDLCFQDTGQDFRGEPDPSPQEERFICEYMKRETGSDAVLITEFPSSAAKFYHYINPEKPAVADRADLLFKGVEIATLSRRISDSNDLIASCKKHGVDVNNLGLKDYLEAFAYGMPAEGGFGMGLERITQKIFDLANVKEAALFPRDVQRLSP